MDSTIVNLTKIASVKKITNLTEQKIAYRLLKPIEKQTLWLNKFQKIIDNNKISKNSFTVEQIFLINQLKMDLSIVSFEKNTDSSEYFKNIYIPKFLNKAKQVFTREQIYILFYNVPFDHIVIRANDEAPDCECNSGSIISCSFGSNSCDDDPTCKIVYDNCGFLWKFDCDGMC